MARKDRSTVHWGAKVNGMGEENGWVGSRWEVGGDIGLVGYGMKPKADRSRKGRHWALAIKEGRVVTWTNFMKGRRSRWRWIVIKRLSVSRILWTRDWLGSTMRKFRGRWWHWGQNVCNADPAGSPEMDEVSNVVERVVGEGNGSGLERPFHVTGEMWQVSVGRCVGRELLFFSILRVDCDSDNEVWVSQE